MPLSRDEHETLLNELLTPDLEHSRKTDILTALRQEKAEVDGSIADLTKTKEKLTADNQDLILSNSKLFRQIPIVNDPQQSQQQQQKTFSETVTISQLEENANNNL